MLEVLSALEQPNYREGRARLGAHEEIVVPRITAGVRSSRWPSRPVRPSRYGQAKGCYGPTRVPWGLGGQRARRAASCRGAAGGDGASRRLAIAVFRF